MLDKKDEKTSVEQTQPALEINKIIQLIVDVSIKKNKTLGDAAKEFAESSMVFAKNYAKEKARDLIETAVEKAGMEELSNHEFSDQLINTSGTIVSHVRAYMAEKITEQQLVELIGESGIKDISMQVFSALGIHEKRGVENSAEIMLLPPHIMAYNASMAAYEELRKALEDLTIAKERRRQIEAACAESVSMIRHYRGEMEKIVSVYLTNHLETFESGFAAMDRALIEGDINGYIKGNVEIQSILGRDVQFKNQDEFDTLMDSDDAFKL